MSQKIKQQVCSRCGQALEKRPAHILFVVGRTFAFEGVPARVCPACDWRTVARGDVEVMERALDTRMVSAKGMLNVPLYAFSEARRAVLEGKPMTEKDPGPGLVQDAPHAELTGQIIGWAMDYFAGTNCNVALLFNFGRPRLEWKRLFPPKKIQEHRRKQWGKPLE